MGYTNRQIIGQQAREFVQKFKEAHLPYYCLKIIKKGPNSATLLPGGRWHDDGHLTLDDLRRIHESVKEEIMHESESVLQWVRSSQGVLRCRMCPYKTKDEDKFERHQGSVHRLKGVGSKGNLSGSSGSDKSGQGSGAASGRALLSCEHCDFTADLAQNLRTHALSCLGLARRKLFRCPQCPFQTPRMHEISRHMNAHLFGAAAAAVAAAEADSRTQIAAIAERTKKRKAIDSVKHEQPLQQQQQQQQQKPQQHNSEDDAEVIVGDED